MDQVGKVREATDIVALISSYISLKKAGANFKSQCPFHSEKSPSFVVSPERQIWHCFGCQKGGDAFTFLMEYEHIEFPEALRILADKAGIALEHQKYDSGLSSKKETIYKINRLAAEFYHYVLTKHTVGKDALNYVQNTRHVKPATMKTFLIGYAPKNGSALTTYLIKKKGYKAEDLFDAGLITRRGTQLFDFFQNRIMFALFDHRDNIVGFSGRVINASDHPSKYMNTRDTIVYHKGQTFFGFQVAKTAIKKEDEAILMEGEFDVISSFQEGVSNAVAVKGTALTIEQVNLLSRFCTKVALCFDEDSAGQEALKRSVSLLEKKNMTTTVVVIDNAKDPDEAIQKNPVAFKKAVKESVNVYDYLLTDSVQKFSPNSAEGKKQITKVLLPFFGEIENEIVREHYLQKLAESLHTSLESIQKEIEKLRKQEVVKTDIFVKKNYQTRQERLEEYLLSLLIQHPNPKQILTFQKELEEYQWNVTSFDKIVRQLIKYITTHDVYSSKEFAKALPEELLPAFDACFLLPITQFDGDEKYTLEIQHILHELLAMYYKKQIQEIGDLLSQKEKDGQSDDVEKLKAQLAHVVTRLRK